MPSLTRIRLASPVVVLILLVVLGLLTGIQYQWTKRVSEATRLHVGADLRKSILAWHLDLFRSLAAAPTALTVNTGPEGFQDRASYVARYLAWRAIAPHPNIVSNVYIYSANADKRDLVLRLNPATSRFEPAAWNLEFEPLRERLRKKSSLLALAIAGASSPEEFFGEHPENDRPFQIRGYAENPLGGWVFEPEIPALFHPIAHEDIGQSRPGGSNHSGADWIVIEYDRKALRQELLPELAERYFSGRKGLEYQVEVLAEGDRPSVIYSSDAPVSPIKHPDATLDIFGRFGRPPLRPLESPIDFSDDEDEVDDVGYSASRQSYEFRGAFWFPVMRAGPNGHDWYLQIAHRQNSLSELSAQVRRRDLAISFGVLALLVLSMGFLAVASRRAQHLAKLQVDFVAGVSHDLRTPLAIISLAADNLADGVVSSREAVVRYGTRLQDQVRQLTGRVEQILQFASIDRSKPRYTLEPVDVASVLDIALRNLSALFEERGIVCEADVEHDLPHALADASVLTQALQNVIDNAVKYGGEDRWLSIRAASGNTRKDGMEVQIIVEDHGMGIEKSELSRIFDPFYRSPLSVSRQIYGSGLGLTLAKKTMEGMGGSISISSIPGKGTSVVLCLPSALPGAAPERMGVGASTQH